MFWELEIAYSRMASRSPSRNVYAMSTYITRVPRNGLPVPTSVLNRDNTTRFPYLLTGYYQSSLPELRSGEGTEWLYEIHDSSLTQLEQPNMLNRQVGELPSLELGRPGEVDMVLSLYAPPLYNKVNYI